jgi:hypothetical protein
MAAKAVLGSRTESVEDLSRLCDDCPEERIEIKKSMKITVTPARILTGSLAKSDAR